MGDAHALLHLHFDPAGELLAAARECEMEVFHHWFGNTSDELEAEYAPYAAATTFLVLADARGHVLGEVRLVMPSPAGLKTLDDIGAPPWGVDGQRAAHAARMDLSSTWEVATMGVRPGLRGGGVQHALAIYHGLVLVARANAVTGMVAILDQRVRGLLEAVGLVYPAIPGTAPAPYLGSPSSVPVFVDFASMLDNQRRRAPEAHRLIALGIGLDGIAVPELEHFRYRSAGERAQRDLRAG
jgi:hypothetical protein